MLEPTVNRLSVAGLVRAHGLVSVNAANTAIVRQSAQNRANTRPDRTSAPTHPRADALNCMALQPRPNTIKEKASVSGRPRLAASWSTQGLVVRAVMMPISGPDTPPQQPRRDPGEASQDRQCEPLPPQQPERSGAQEKVGTTASQEAANPPVGQLAVPVVDVRDGHRRKRPVRADLVGGAPQAQWLVLAVDRQHSNLLDLRRQTVVQLARRRTGQGVDVDQPTAVEDALEPLGEFPSPGGVGRGERQVPAGLVPAAAVGRLEEGTDGGGRGVVRNLLRRWFGLGWRDRGCLGRRRFRHLRKDRGRQDEQHRQGEHGAPQRREGLGHTPIPHRAPWRRQLGGGH